MRTLLLLLPYVAIVAAYAWLAVMHRRERSAWCYAALTVAYLAHVATVLLVH